MIKNNVRLKLDFSKKLDKEILKIAEPIMDNLIEGSNEFDYKKFSKDFSRLMMEAVPEEEFRSQLDKLNSTTGKIENKREFIGCVRRDTGVTILWVGYFEKIQGEVLSQLSLDEEENEIKVFGALVN